MPAGESGTYIRGIAGLFPANSASSDKSAAFQEFEFGAFMK